MLGLLLLIFLALVVGATIILLTHSQRKSVKNSPFTNQYNHLVHLLINNRKFEIQKVKSHSMAIRITLHRDAHFFTLAQIDGRLHVNWKLHSGSFGKREKEWFFEPDQNQAKIYEEILTDLRNYLKKLRSERQYLDQSFLSVV